MASALQLFGGADDAAENDGSVSQLENPEDQAQQAQPYGPQNRDLPEELIVALKALLREASRQEMYQRLLEVMRDRRNRFFERGLQHIYENLRTGMFVIGIPGAVVKSGDEKIQCGHYIADYNIFHRALQIVIAKLTENPSGIDFQPDSGDSDIDEQAAHAAEGNRILYDRRNDLKDLQTAIVRMFGLSGRTVGWTRNMADEQRWGTDATGGSLTVQTTSVKGTLEWKLPIIAASFAECPYAIYTEDPHIAVCKQEHPYFADKIHEQGNTGESDTQFERIARLGILQGSMSAFQFADTYDCYLERKHGFFRSAWFTSKELDSAFYDPAHAEDVDENGALKDWTLRDALLELFPHGCHVTFVGDVYVGSRDMCLDDEITVDFPYAGDGMSRMAVMDPAVIIQRRFNDWMNAFDEAGAFGWPSTWIRGDKADISAINDQTAAPYCYRALKMSGPADMKMPDNFWREPDPDIPASFSAHVQYLATTLLQFILAIPSAVQGAGMVDQKTASGYHAAIEQALGQLGVIRGAMDRFMASVYRQAALLAVKVPDGQRKFVIPGPKGSVTVDIEALGKGHFLAHPDTDSGYPESTMQKRATLGTIMDMATRNPAMAEAIFSSPDNWDLFSKTMGVPELVIPEARSRRKQAAEIETLVQQSPVAAVPPPVQPGAEGVGIGVDGVPQPAAPLPPVQHSSIPPSPEDYHEWEAEECKEKLSDWPWVQGQIASGNTEGIANIRLHYQEHMQYVQQAAMAAQQAEDARIAATKPKSTESWKPATVPPPASA
jgi:hypothetical protein